MASPNNSATPLPWRVMTGMSAVRSTTVVGTTPQDPLSSIKSTRRSRRLRISSASFNGAASPGSISVDDSNGSPSSASSARTTAVRRYAHADGFAARMQQPARHFARCVQDEGVTAGRCRLDQPELPVVDARIGRRFGQIAAQQPEMVACIDLAYRADALHRRLVADVTAEGVARIRRIDDHPAVANDRDRLADQPQLRIIGMNGKNCATATQ